MKLRPNRSLDLRDEECPFTVLELGKAARTLAEGDVLEVMVGREAAVSDVRAWCEGTGNEFLASEVGAVIKVYLRKV